MRIAQAITYIFRFKTARMWKKLISTLCPINSHNIAVYSDPIITTALTSNGPAEQSIRATSSQSTNLE